MSLLNVSNLTKSFGPDDIFASITFSIPYHARYAIVGPNGVGKTTLLRIIAGLEPTSGGEVHLARGISLGYLPQEVTFSPQDHANQTLWEACLAAFEDLREMEAELKDLEAEMSSSKLSEEGLEKALERYGALQSHFERRGGYTYEARIRAVLSGIGFDPFEFDFSLSQLSGGQRTRGLLARLLLSDHDLLLLDEPTNHLDIAAVEWLEGYLRDWDGAALFISHDRYFIDRIATHILEMDRGVMEMYRGNYSAYLEQRQERWAKREEFFEAEKARLEKELDYIKRNIAGQNTLQAKGKLRRLSRYLEAVEQLGFEGMRGKKWSEIAVDADTGYPMGVAEAESRIKALQPPNHQHHRLNLILHPKQRSGKIILRTHELQIGYPGNSLFTAPDLELHRLECAAIIGPNGSGKSTLLKTVLSQVEPLRGEITLGASLDIAYFAQAHEGLDPNHTLMEEIDSVAPSMLPGEIRSYLARFLFTGEEVFKPVSVLSGGERGRLALAKLALTDANLLLLDEPTNHLDIPSQEILQEVLSNFEGTIILVSHDRYLIDALATQVWEIRTDPGVLEVYKGSYSEYRERQQEAGGENAAYEDESAGQTEWAREKRQRNRALSEERTRQRRLKELETLIHIQEEKLAALAKKLENPPADASKVEKLGLKYAHLKRSLDSLLEEWTELHA